MRRAVLVMSTTLAAAVPAHAQAAAAPSGHRYALLYGFPGGTKGSAPQGNLANDQAANLYGTTQNGGNPNCFGGAGCGTVFELTAGTGGKLHEKVLHAFRFGVDGALPMGGVVVDPAGNLFGATALGGGRQGNFGTVFRLAPPAQGATKWTKTILHAFGGSGHDGQFPGAGVIIDANGNLLGTTEGGGKAGFGIAYRIALGTEPKQGWSETILHSFSGAPDGNSPQAALAADKYGNLFGTTYLGGGQACGSLGCGTVYMLQPPPPGQNHWVETVVHGFAGGADGSGPEGSVLIDATGNLFGTTSSGGSSTCSGGAPGCGIVFELSPPSKGQTNWSETILHIFTGGTDGGGPAATLATDSSGNLYGTTASGGNAGCGYGCGVAFELIRPVKGQTEWNFVVLHSFTGGRDGGNPESPLLAVPSLDGFVGTTFTGGLHRGQPGGGTTYSLHRG